MSKYIIKNCPCYDHSIEDWNCLGSDATECKNGHCLIKQMFELLREVEMKSAELTFGEFKQYIDEDFLDKAYNLFDKEEVG